MGRTTLRQLDELVSKLNKDSVNLERLVVKLLELNRVKVKFSNSYIVELFENNELAKIMWVNEVLTNE